MGEIWERINLEFGTILRHQKFRFHDGATARKFLIVLNSPDLDADEPYVLAKTTSNGHAKDTRIGCSKNNLTFHIPANQDYFPLNTWIILNELYIVEPISLLNDHHDGICEIVGELKNFFKKQLINCILTSEDIEEAILNLILKSYYRKKE